VVARMDHVVLSQNFWSEILMQPTYTIWQFAKAINKWYEITNHSSISYPDITHSALLRRILSGGSIYPYPPPKSYSYPWYELLDDGISVRADVQPWTSKVSTDWKRGAKWKVETERLVVINQTVWGLEAEISDTELIATFPYYKLRVRCTLNEVISGRNMWTVEVIENENVVMK